VMSNDETFFHKLELAVLVDMQVPNFALLVCVVDTR
jgi:hypothetical protein